MSTSVSSPRAVVRPAAEAGSGHRAYILSSSVVTQRSGRQAHDLIGSSIRNEFIKMSVLSITLRIDALAHLLHRLTWNASRRPAGS